MATHVVVDTSMTHIFSIYTLYLWNNYPKVLLYIRFFNKDGSHIGFPHYIIKGCVLNTPMRPKHYTDPKNYLLLEALGGCKFEIAATLYQFITSIWHEQNGREHGIPFSWKCKVVYLFCFESLGTSLSFFIIQPVLR